MTTSPSSSGSGSSHPRPRRAISSHLATWDQIRASSPDVPRGPNGVTSKGYGRREQLCSDAALTSRWTHQSRAARPAVRLLLRSLLASPPQPLRPASPEPLQTQARVHKTIPPRRQGHRNNYKKINTGMRCHLVSRPANTPPGNVPVPPVH